MSLDNTLAARHANFVHFAYNMFQPGVLQPPVDPGIAAAGFDLLYYLNAADFDTPQFYGYLAASKNNPKELVLAVRGTLDPAEWLLNFIALPVFFTPVPEAGFVALGFLTIFNSFRFVDGSGASFNLAEVMDKLAGGPGIDKLTIVGHSLGGALATLAAAQLAIQNRNGLRDKLTIITLGSPRTGLLDFAASFDGAVRTSFRIWNTLDIVPQVPTFPYIHVSGMGDGIVQTKEQLNTLIVTPACEHHLTTYQWLLDAGEFPLDLACSSAQGGAVAFDVDPTGSNAQTTGALRLRRAMAGRD